MYCNLFNRESDSDDIKKIQDGIEQEINDESFSEINKINMASIRDALGKIKSNKSDPICNFSSDFLKNGPDILIYHLEVMIKTFLIHGHVSEILLLATLVPIVKDKLGDLCD